MDYLQVVYDTLSKAVDDVTLIKTSKEETPHGVYYGRIGGICLPLERGEAEGGVHLFSSTKIQVIPHTHHPTL